MTANLVPAPRSMPTRILLGALYIAIAVALVLFLGRAWSDSTMRWVGVVVAGIGTLTQLFLAMDHGGNQRIGESTADHQDRLRWREGPEAISWVFITIGLLMAVSVELP